MGDASVPALHLNHPRPYETTPPPFSFHTNLSLKEPFKSPKAARLVDRQGQAY